MSHGKLNFHDVISKKNLNWKKKFLIVNFLNIFKNHNDIMRGAQNDGLTSEYTLFLVCIFLIYIIITSHSKYSTSVIKKIVDSR